MTPLKGPVLATLLIATFAGGCSTSPSMNDVDRLAGTAWVLSGLTGRDRVDTTVTLRFDEGRAGGTDGCNRYSRPYETTGNRLEFGAPGVSTQMACPPPIAEQADALRSSLDRTRSYRVDAQRLELIAEDGSVLASFEPQPEGLAGTNWKVVAYNNGKQAVVSLLSGTEVTMQFATDGRVSGSAGCNQYTGSYTHDGSTLRFSPAAATRRMCARPEGIMEQEQQFLKSLEMVTNAMQEGDKLELRGERGQLVVSLVSMPAE
jgi:heat shock protein HslJ